MARVAVQCPGCLAKLNLSDDSKLGKKIKCPKCSDIFVAEAADDDDEQDDEPKSGGGRKRPAAGKKGAGKKGKSSAGGSNPAVIVGGIVAVVVLIGAGLFFSGVFGGGNPPAIPVEPVPVQPMAANPVPPPAAPPAPAVPAMSPVERTLGLRWMPAGMQMLIHVKVSELWTAALLKEFIDSPQLAAMLQETEKMTGLTPSDVESVTLGMTDMDSAQSMVMSRGMGGGAPPKLMAVIRTKKSMSLDDILTRSKEIKAAEHNSKKYFATSDESLGGWIAEPKTLILSSVLELKATMDRGETMIPRKELLVMDANPHVIMIVAPTDPKALFGAPVPPLPGMSPESAAMQKVLAESLTTFAIGISISGGVDLQTAMILRDVENAGKVKAGLESAIAEGKQQYAALKFIVPPPLSDLGDVVLNNLKVELKDQTVKVFTGIPNTEQAKIEQAIQMAKASSGMGGPPGRPGFSPGGPGRPPGGQPLFDKKNPGESQPISADSAEGIPEGASLAVATAWNRFPTLAADGKPLFPVQILLDLQGDAIDKICGSGLIAIKTGTLAGGGTLKVVRIDSMGLPNPTKLMIPFDASNTEFTMHPEGTMRQSLLVEAPTAAESTIAALEGTFKYLTSDDSEEFMIEDAAKTAKRPLSDPALKAAGVKLILSKTETGESLTLLCAKGFYLGNAMAVYAGSAPNQNPLGGQIPFRVEMDKSQPVQRLLPIGGKFPDQLLVKFKLYRGVKEQTVEFKFANVPLPPPEAMPQLPPPPSAQFPGGPGGGPIPPGLPQPPGGTPLPPGAPLPPGVSAPPGISAPPKGN